MRTQNHIYTLLILLFTISCGASDKNNQGDEHKEESAHNHEVNKEENKEEVHLVQKQMDVMGIELGKFQYLNLSTTVKSNGQLELPPQNKASLSAIMGGRVKSVNVLVGDYVTKGQILATLEHPVFVELQEQYLTSKSQLKFLENDYERKKGLYTDSISSEKTFQQSEADYNSAIAKVNGLKAKLKLLDIDITTVEKGNFHSAIPIRSPINGYIRLIEINMGKYIQPEKEMFEIVDNEHIHIDLLVYEKDMNKVKKGQKVVFSLANNPNEVFEGKIFAVGKSFEKEPKAMVVHAEIDNRNNHILPGMYVDARIITNDERVQAVPNDAIVSEGGLSYIFVLKPASTVNHAHEEGEDHNHGESENHEDEHVFRKIEVNIGATDIGFTEVVPAYSLPDHIQIVTKGAFYLFAEMKKGEGGNGHHH